MTILQPVKPGLSAPIVTSIPDQWSKTWFRSFITNYLQNADIRNAVTPDGGGVQVSASNFTQPATISFSPIPNNTVYGNVSGTVAPPVAITPTQLTTLINVFTTGIKGAVPPSPGGVGQFLRADGNWAGLSLLASPPTALVGLTAVDGTANSFMSSDSAPALDQSIAPTWTGTHTFLRGVVLGTAIGGNRGDGSINAQAYYLNGLPFPSPSRGPAGKDGRDGKRGASGVPGVAGSNGTIGHDGRPGRNGRDGLDGKRGPPGISQPGSTGTTGAQGLTGRAGRNGKDGLDGRRGPPGVGSQGASGAAGTNGKNGNPGRNGKDGLDGRRGPPGLPGAPGATGAQGLTGRAGRNGKDGLDGRRGPPGVSGTGGGGAVSSVSGTANQITVAPTTGAVVLSLPVNVVIPTSTTGVALTVNGQAGSANALLVSTPNDGQITSNALAGGQFATVTFAVALAPKTQIYWDNVGGNFNINTASGSGGVAITTSTGVAILAPTTGAALRVTANGSAQMAVWNGPTANAYMDYQNNGVLTGRHGSADSIVVGGISTDFAMTSPAGGITFATSGTSIRRLRIDANGLITAPASPLSSTATQVFTGLANTLVAAQGFTSSTTLTAIPGLTVTCNETGLYTFEAFLTATEVTLGTGGFKCDFAGGTATIANIVGSSIQFISALAGATFNATTTVMTLTTVATSAPGSWLLIKGRISVSVAGTFGMRGAQTASSANTTSLNIGSYINLTKIG